MPTDQAPGSRLRRVLGPALPILRPIARPIRRWVREQDPSLVADRIVGLVEGATGRGGMGRGPIRPLRRWEIAALAKTVPYYQPRVEYLTAASRAIGELQTRYRIETVLELGPHLRSIVHGGDVMDLTANPDLQVERGLVVHDATVVPWPVEDRAYDLFVALQVFEHLRGHQVECFREVRRVARHAVLSLPIDWVMADPTNIHHMLSHEHVRSWFAPVEPTRVLIGNRLPKKRLIYVFEDLPPP